MARLPTLQRVVYLLRLASASRPNCRCADSREENDLGTYLLCRRHTGSRSGATLQRPCCFRKGPDRIERSKARKLGKPPNYEIGQYPQSCPRARDERPPPVRIRRARFISAVWLVRFWAGCPRRAVLAFDPASSYSVTYAAQGADRGFAMGLMGKPLTDESFFTSLGDARDAGMEIEFQIRKLANPDHPNTVELDLTAADGSALRLVARSIGGGEVEITSVDGRPVLFNGSAYETLVEVGAEKADAARELLAGDDQGLEDPASSSTGDLVRLTAARKAALPGNFRDELRGLDGGLASMGVGAGLLGAER